jgi:hypothetical protein
MTVPVHNLEGGQSCPQPAFSRLWPPVANRRQASRGGSRAYRRLATRPTLP